MNEVVEALVVAILALVLIYLIFAPCFIWNIRKSIDKVARELEIMVDEIRLFKREVEKKNERNN